MNPDGHTTDSNGTSYCNPRRGRRTPCGVASTNRTTPEVLVVYCNYLDLPPALQAYCVDIAGRARARNVGSGRSPVSIASGIIYFTAMLFGYSVSLKEIGTMVGVSEGTIKLVYRLLWADPRKPRE